MKKLKLKAKKMVEAWGYSKEEAVQTFKRKTNGKKPTRIQYRRDLVGYVASGAV
jgi:hypothetical protein